MRQKTALLLAAVLLGAASGPVLAQGSPRSLGSFDAWDAYVQGEGRTRVCFAVSRPTETLPKDARRGEIYAMVSHRPAERVQSEINISFGYPLRREARAEAQIGAAKFALAVFEGKDYESHGFAPDAAQDKEMAEQIARGAQMVVRGTSQRGTATTDTYSLKGASAALKAIAEACK
ncbi:MAG: hypothetical protein KIT20_02210 [Alphaproteobacteria bacterium]|nr:hypothetical protein [Alphaproteobacteria bacterium]